MTPKILSVDDSKTIRLLLMRLFRPFQCEVLEAENGEQGLAVVARERPDLVLLDYNMPVMDGLTMLRRLRAEEASRRLPVILLTAEAGCDNIAAIARLGVRDYVAKPFQDADLLAKVARILPLVPRNHP